MRIQFYGAAQTVTGSKHLITTEKGTQILLDCGMFQGIQTDDFNQRFGFEPSEIDYLLLTHAHIDHSGLIPRLVRQGFEGPIYCTSATIDLCRIMLMDSAYIQEKDLQRVNERRRRQNREELELLYSVDDVHKTLELMKPVQYNQRFSLNDGEVEAFFTDAGHILGSAAVHLAIPDQGTFKYVTFTGDIGRPNDKILNSPQPFPQPDILICESTYGDRLHENASDMKEKLLEVIRETCIENKGKLLIPAFAVDRTQELIYALDQLSSEGLLPRIDVYIDSPLAVQATRIMKRNDEYFNPEILSYIEKDGDAFAFPNLHYISDVEQSKALNSSDEPCIIISASGMAEAGRIKHHIANNITKHSTTILLVGYAGPETLAGALKRGDRTVKIFGEELPVNAKVRSMDSFSGHGDYNEMINYLSGINSEKVKKVFLVHGEPDTQDVFRKKLLLEGFRDVIIPQLYEGFVV